jgi:cytochrome c
LTGPAAALLVLLAAPPAQAGDAASGERLFRTQCASCHSGEPGRHKVGPSLFGVVGRPYGTAPGFRYPPADRDAAVVWDAESLDKYLTDPKSVLPRTAMPYAGLRNPAQRADIVAYLATLR